jgi:AGZA family xanthine/uracil permease-like MFS transporter
VIMINGGLAAAGTIVPAMTPEAKAALIGAMKNEGILYHGMEVLGGGSILGGLILTAIGVCVIDRTFRRAAAFAGAGAVMTFFGFMHGDHIGFAQSPTVALSYLIIAGVFVACAKLVTVEKPAVEREENAPLPVGALAAE